MSHLYERTALSYHDHKQFDESIRAVSKAIHLQPNAYSTWFNLACVREDHAMSVLMNNTKNVSEIHFAISELELGQACFHFLSTKLERSFMHTAEKAKEHETFCHVSAYLAKCSSKS